MLSTPQIFLSMLNQTGSAGYLLFHGDSAAKCSENPVFIFMLSEDSLKDKNDLRKRLNANGRPFFIGQC